MSDATRHFDEKAEKWDESPFGRMAIDNSISALRSVVSLTSSMDVLDWGCGSGLMLKLISPEVNSVTGIDISAGMIQQCKKKQTEDETFAKKSTFLKLELDKPGLIDKKFDVIVTCNVLHHVDDFKMPISILKSYLKPGGYLVIVELLNDETTTQSMMRYWAEQNAAGNSPSNHGEMQSPEAHEHHGHHHSHHDGNHHSHHDGNHHSHHDGNHHHGHHHHGHHHHDHHPHHGFSLEKLRETLSETGYANITAKMGGDLIKEEEANNIVFRSVIATGQNL